MKTGIVDTHSHSVLSEWVQNKYFHRSIGFRVFTFSNHFVYCTWLEMYNAWLNVTDVKQNTHTHGTSSCLSLLELQMQLIMASKVLPLFSWTSLMTLLYLWCVTARIDTLSGNILTTHSILSSVSLFYTEYFLSLVHSL